MHQLHTALLLALGLTAAPVAVSQSRVNEGPNVAPKAETPYDAEHVPTQGNTARDAQQKKQDSSSRMTDGPPRSRDDAEHAPTQGSK